MLWKYTMKKMSWYHDSLCRNATALILTWSCPGVPILYHVSIRCRDQKYEDFFFLVISTLQCTTSTMITEVKFPNFLLTARNLHVAVRQVSFSDRLFVTSLLNTRKYVFQRKQTGDRWVENRTLVLRLKGRPLLRSLSHNKKASVLFFTNAFELQNKQLCLFCH